MALVTCQYCGDQYSSSLTSCPVCEDKGIKFHPQQDSTEGTISKLGKENTTAKLVELKQLHDSGDLSDAEFAVAKNKILGIEDNKPPEPQIHSDLSSPSRKLIPITAGLLVSALVAVFVYLAVTGDKKSADPPDDTALTTGPPTVENIIQSLEKRAEAGESDAAFELGQMYWYGQDVIKDKEEAYRWFQRAAELEDAPAQYIIGMKSYEASAYYEAIGWFLKAAQLEHADAQYNLGRMYYDGIGTSKNHKVAAVWWTAAANQGRADAQVNIGHMYSIGEGVRKDHYKAVDWYLKAAMQGNAQAQFNLGLSYAEGRGVRQSDENGIKWYFKAARQGHSGALNNLGVFYKYDVRDYPRAMAFYVLAGKSGSAKGKENADNLVRQFGTRAFDGWSESNKIVNELTDVIRFNVANRPKSNPEDKLVPRPFWTLKVKSSGTGFFVTQDGYLITNYHVIEDAKRVEIRTANRKRIRASVVKEDRANDLAVLKVDGENFSALPLASSETVGLGEDVFTIGFPQASIQGFSAKLTKGSISSLAGMRDDISRFQHSVPSQPGNSGGPMLDNHGNVVGVIVARLNVKGSQNVNYAIKSSLVKKLLESIPETRGTLLKATRRNGSKRFTSEVGKATQAATVMVLIY